MSPEPDRKPGPAKLAAWKQALTRKARKQRAGQRGPVVVPGGRVTTAREGR